MINKLLCLLGVHERSIEFMQGERWIDAEPGMFVLCCAHCGRLL